MPWMTPKNPTPPTSHPAPSRPRNYPNLKQGVSRYGNLIKGIGAGLFVTLIAVSIWMLVWKWSKNAKSMIDPNAVRNELPVRMRDGLTDDEIFHYRSLAEWLVAQWLVYDPDATKDQMKKTIHAVVSSLALEGVDTPAEKQEFQATVWWVANAWWAQFDLWDEDSRGVLDGAIGAKTVQMMTQAATWNNVKVVDDDDRVAWKNFGGSEHDVEFDGEKIFDWPLPPQFDHITSWFGRREQPIEWASTNHGGIDIRADEWTPISASMAWTVVFAGEQVDQIPGAGIVNGVLNRFEDKWFPEARRALKKAGLDPTEAGWRGVTIDHGNGYRTYYGHMRDYTVREWQQVQAWDVIGYVWSTGTSTADHLHYEVRKWTRDNRVNPLQYTAKPWEERWWKDRKTNAWIVAALATVLWLWAWYQRRRNRRKQP